MTDYRCAPELAAKLESLMDVNKSSDDLKAHFNWIDSLPLKPGDRVEVPAFPGWQWVIYHPPVH